MPPTSEGGGYGAGAKAALGVRPSKRAEECALKVRYLAGIGEKGGDMAQKSGKRDRSRP